MGRLQTFHLPKWIEGNADKAKVALGGSATSPLSLDDLVALSSDPAKTEAAFKFSSMKLAGPPSPGSLGLRQAIANMYNHAITAEHVVTTVSTTGANMTAMTSLLQAGDHVICQYPTYPQLLGLPKSFQCEISYWRLDPEKGWRGDVEELRSLIKPETRMMVLNNPSNPTGFHFDEETQREILEIAREKNVIVFVDEIFRPLYHGQPKPAVPSFVEHDYPKVLVTGSLSKAWALTGVRCGWIACRDRDILDLIMNAREYTFQYTSAIDEIIATEALSPRCRTAILARHLENARQGLELLDAFVEKNRDVVSWTRPHAAATAFVKFSEPNGEAVDDNELCRQVVEEQGLLLTPGSLGFSDDERQSDFRGYVRIHFTVPPERLRQGLELLDAFLDKRRNKSPGGGNQVGAKL